MLYLKRDDLYSSSLSPLCLLSRLIHMLSLKMSESLSDDVLNDTYLWYKRRDYVRVLFISLLAKRFIFDSY